jgi:hypothetical protein
VSPKSFLHELGIKPIRKGKFSARYRKIIAELPAKEGGQVDDVMGIAEMNPLFVDEEIAVETLRGNFDRLANSMERVESSPVFKKGKLERVCDLGGGTGIIGMWLAKNGKCGFCEVVDHAEKPLAIGRKWAEKCSIQGVEFKHASYAALAAAGSHDFDFVFAEHGVDLGFVPQSPDLPAAPSDENVSSFLKRYLELAGAFSGLLGADAVGLIGGSTLTPESLSLLCKALRQHQLTIDWKLSSNDRGLLLHIRPHGHIVLDSTEDEALAILADALPARKVPPAEARSLEAMFRQGKTFAEVCSEGEGTRYKCSIIQCAGLACVFQRSSKGHEVSTLFSAAKMHVWTEDVFRDAAKRNVTKRFIDDQLSPLLDGKVISATR